MTAYSDLVTAASDLDTSLADLVTKAKALFDKAAVYESSVRTSTNFEGNPDAADAGKVLRAALIAAIVADGTANGFKLAKVLRLPVRGSGRTAALVFP
jgi:hypothetical protein